MYSLSSWVISFTSSAFLQRSSSILTENNRFSSFFGVGLSNSESVSLYSQIESSLGLNNLSDPLPDSL